ncbi:MAG TPA: hypothetical protein VMH87_20675 [Pseudomonadales bacterium]|nr:hypothetical protein [Pseudomonadales bacterium]
MKSDTRKKAGWLFIFVGALLVLFSKPVVFRGLVWLLGMETIAGKNNIVYMPDGSYHLINPRPATVWIVSVVVIGILIWLAGCWMLFQPRKGDGRTGS